ncbi:MAG: stage V sporulation protein S, partial [Candidatus Eremiobacteraeota bacterium]|nr:stage V sporulation protein S [Candidatus Eremiobacteraeota bacterium]
MSADGPLKVSTKSNPNAVAGALAASIRERDSAELQAVGAGAINQAIKAVAIARNYLKAADIDIVCVPAFITVAISDNERTGISLIVERRVVLAPYAKDVAIPE